MKRSFSLIEMLISLALLSLLLTTLFYWYNTLSKEKQLLDHVTRPILDERYCQQRLNAIMPKVQLPFYGSEESMVFIFNRGASLCPELSSEVLARLYYDSEQKALCLGIWPKPEHDKPKKTPSMTSVLLDHVDSCSFSFYFPPDPLQKPVSPEEVGKLKPSHDWQDQWLAEYGQLPALIHIAMQRQDLKDVKKHSVDYYFDLGMIPLFARTGA